MAPWPGIDYLREIHIYYFFESAPEGCRWGFFSGGCFKVGHTSPTVGECYYIKMYKQSPNRSYCFVPVEKYGDDPKEREINIV